MFSSLCDHLSTSADCKSVYTVKNKTKKKTASLLLTATFSLLYNLPLIYNMLFKVKSATVVPPQQDDSCLACSC